ncbi:MAG: methionine gamma-lyase family protein, partial [Clostridia bacterium]|nr:methionine gamma-lyase family protein [Clostridia bacterium]
MEHKREYYEIFNIDPKLITLARAAEEAAKASFERIDAIKEQNQLKVIRAMQLEKLSDTHFSGTTGYGYNDRGREILDAVYAHALHAEDALVRHSITCGSHALALCLYGLLRPGDELLAITGKPYDTLDEVIGIRGREGDGSLKDFGVTYGQVDLTAGGLLDDEAIKKAISPKTKLIFIQRSRGYAWRPALTISEIERIVKLVKGIKPGVWVMVDNCYGEFVEEREPTEVGVDIIAGSLIKNPGGGLVPSGGYVAGKKELVEKIAFRQTVPGLGKEVGATLGQNRLLFQGFFMAPHVVAESLKGAVFAAQMMQSLGFDTYPGPSDPRCDLIQAIRFNREDAVIAFCQGIQKGSPVDSYVTPQPWDMPGYDSPVIMAAGAFIQGSSIELSADAPIRPPYTCLLY